MTDQIPEPDDALADLDDAGQVALIERTDNSFSGDVADGLAQGAEFEAS